MHELPFPHINAHMTAAAAGTEKQQIAGPQLIPGHRVASFQ